jgi:formate/nitrite transporter FocA (FNT family)
MMMGADISVTRLLFQALLPATLGNLAGGGLLFAAVYWYALDSMATILPKSKPDSGSPALSAS